LAFTTEEKVQAGKFVHGMIELMDGVTKLAQVGRTHGHLLRTNLYTVIYVCHSVWVNSRSWFTDLSGTPRVGLREDRTRAQVLLASKEYYDRMMNIINGLVTNKTLLAVPQFADAYVNIKKARDIFVGFDWSLAYADPRHDESNTQFPDTKTIVGPHGDWARAVGSLKFVMWYLGHTWRNYLGLYQQVPVYVEGANQAFGDQIESFARLANRVARVYSMHIEIEAPSDALAIDADHAKDSGARTRDFHRAMRQNELLFNNRHSEGKNWHGRDFEIGGLRTLEFETLERFVLPLAKANDPQWVYDIVISDNGVFGGGHAAVTGQLTDFWQMFDAWGVAVFSFYHVMPAPTIFKPRDGSEDPPDEPAIIPFGFFDSQAEDIEEQKAGLAAVDVALGALRDNLQAIEGTEV